MGIVDNNRIGDNAKVVKGFHHLVAEGMRCKADAVSHQLSWPYDSQVCGVIQDKRHDKDIYTIRKWMTLYMLFILLGVHRTIVLTESLSARIAHLLPLPFIRNAEMQSIFEPVNLTTE